MREIIITKSCDCSSFDGDQYIVDLDRKFGGYKAGDLICYVFPFDIPLELEIAIRNDGTLVFRSWAFAKREPNPYLHTDEKPENFVATQEQIDTVNGLFSGRIKFEGLKLAVGATVQHVCPIDVKREEELTGKTIYVN